MPDAEQMTVNERRKCLKRMQGRYLSGTREERSRLLDELVVLTRRTLVNRCLRLRPEAEDLLASPPGLIPTSDLGGCPLVDYDPVLGLDGAGRSVIYCTTIFNGLAVARRVWLDWVSQADPLAGGRGERLDGLRLALDACQAR